MTSLFLILGYTGFVTVFIIGFKAYILGLSHYKIIKYRTMFYQTISHKPLYSTTLLTYVTNTVITYIIYIPHYFGRHIGPKMGYMMT